LKASAATQNIADVSSVLSPKLSPEQALILHMIA
jgi:hypothetical protein